MNSSIFFFEETSLVNSLSRQLHIKPCLGVIHYFPDQETSVRINPDDVTRTCLVFASLHHPNKISLPLLFLSKTLREYGAQRVILVAPYLAYMRQDKRFHEGEGITAKYYAQLLSDYFDGLVTVDPHLHRIHDLSDVFSIRSHIAHASPAVAKWVAQNIMDPVLIGPDSESTQWVREVADKINAPFAILEKIRRGDHDVEISVPQSERWLNHKPILFDDIISTGKTMIGTVRHLRRAGLAAPVCIGIHALFNDQTYNELLEVGAERVVTTNSITDKSNAIDLTETVAGSIQSLLSSSL